MTDDPQVTRRLERRAGFDEAEGREDFSIIETWRDATGYRHVRQVEILGRRPAIADGITTIAAWRPGPTPRDPGEDWPNLIDAIAGRWIRLGKQPLQRDIPGFPASTIREIAKHHGKWPAALAEARHRIQAMPNP